MQDFGILQIGFAAGSLLVVSIIGILWTHRATVVSIISGEWRSSMERAREQKAARERMYGFEIMSRQEEGAAVAPVVSGVLLRPGSSATAFDLPILSAHLTEAQYIELGARLRDRRGKYVFSGRKLYTLAGGNHDEFLVSMRRWRGDENESIDEPVSYTPIVGRATSARFETDADFPYQAMT